MNQFLTLTAFILLACSGTARANIASQLSRLGLPIGGKRLLYALQNYTYPHGSYPIHIYAAVGQAQHVSIIIQHALSKNENVMLLVNAPDEQGRTPLHRACMGNHVEVAKLLMIHNASITALDHNGKTPRNIAEEMKLEEIIQLFDALKN